MRLTFITLWVALSFGAYAQLEVSELPLEPTKNDSSVFPFQEKYKNFLNSKATPTILYFCPTRNYRKEEYSEKITTLKNSPFLKNLNQKVNMYVFYFNENDVNDKSGVQIKNGEWVNESTCYFLHFDKDRLQRLAANFPREFKIENTSDDASTKVVLFDANRCFPDVPTRLVAYARAIQECAQPNYSDAEVNKFQEIEINQLKNSTQELQKKLDENSKKDASQEEQIFESKDKLNKTNNRIDSMMSSMSDAEILLQAYTSMNTAIHENDIHVNSTSGSSWFLGVRKRLINNSNQPGQLCLTAGISFGTQRATLTRDSMLIEENAEDMNGIGYTHRAYYSGIKQHIQESFMAIPVGLQYAYTPPSLRKLRIIAEAGMQMLFTQQLQSEITEGSVSTAGVYSGFEQEIRNISDLGFIDNQRIETTSNPDLLKDNTAAIYGGLQMEWRIGTMLFLNLNSRYNYSGNRLGENSVVNPIAPTSGLSSYRMNPFQFGLGLTYSFKQ
jgi:hypothetical protein